MQSWEYLEIEVGAFSRGGKSHTKWTDSMGRSGELQQFGLLDGHPNPAPLLNELGAQGWELVAVVGQVHYQQLYLKRPRA